MSWTRVRVANCKAASIRRTPWITQHDKDVVGIRDGPTKTDPITITSGDSIEIDLNDICYSWTGRKFYKVRNPEGWIYEGCIDIGVGANG